MNRYSKKIDKKSSKTEKEEPKFSIFSIIFMVLVLYFFIVIYTQERDIAFLKETQIEISEELADKENEQKLVKKELKQVDTNEFVEKIAREKLKMVKPNEIVYIDTNKKINLKDENNDGW